MNLAGAIIGHMVGDYLLQNDYLANNKKVSSLVCFIHCLLWTLAVSVFSGYYYPSVMIWLFVSHFIIDRWGFVGWYMKCFGQTGFIKHMGPWAIVVVDNTFHLVTIWLAWAYTNTYKI